MSFFSSDFQPQLTNAVKQFEQKTSAELALVVSKHSHHYSDVAWITASALTFIIFSLFMLLEYEFFDNHIYLGTILTFLLSFGLVFGLPFIKMLFVTQKTAVHFCSTAAYAIFAEQKIYKTKSYTGFLVYISLLEKQIFIVADSQVEKNINIQELKTQFADIFNQANPAVGLLNTINKITANFAKALPIRDDDTDELNDEMPFFIHGGFGAKSFKVKKS